MDRVLIQRGGSATSVNFGRKIMWASYLCLIAVCFQFLKQTADAAPVLASPQGTYCKKIPLKATTKPLDCCLPQLKPGETVKPFKLPPKPTVLRERKPAHELAKNRTYVKQYNDAYRIMKSLPPDDRRSFDVQWKLHCSFCNEAFLQRLTGTINIDIGIPLQVHYSWLFLPWHRMLVYFHERILASLIKDDSFTLPFWNWDNQLDEGANQIPAFFVNGYPGENSFLIDLNRNEHAKPPQILPLGSKDATTPQQIKAENRAALKKNVVDKITSRDFLGGPYVIGSDLSKGGVPMDMDPGEAGGLENLHNVAHEWVGLSDTAHPDFEDMGNFIFAGKDPIFYTHHTNVDRLWNVWKDIPDTVTPARNRRRVDFTDPDFLNSEFILYNEKQEMVSVKVRDTLNIADLGYQYQKMTKSDQDWITFASKPSTSRTTEQTWKPTDYPVAAATMNNTIYDDPVSFMVPRRTPNSTDLIGKPIKHVNQLAEDVLMENVKIPHSSFFRLDAFVDLPTADETTDLVVSDYIGTFTHLPSGLVNTTDDTLRDFVKEEAEFRIVNIRFSVSPTLEKLGILDYETPITVTLVPRTESNETVEVTFESMRQDFQ